VFFGVEGRAKQKSCTHIIVYYFASIASTVSTLFRWTLYWNCLLFQNDGHEAELQKPETEKEQSW